MGEQFVDFLKREVDRMTADAAEWKRQALYHNEQHGNLVTEIRAIKNSSIVAYTLVDRKTGEQWKHSKRLVYDTEAGLKQGYASGRWMPNGGWVAGKGYVAPPPFPGPFNVVELRGVL